MQDSLILNDIPLELPDIGQDSEWVLSQLVSLIERHSADLGAVTALAHMDPPTPAIAAKIVGVNAKYNQNLLHPDLSPLATEIEKRVINWLLPYFGMADGHFCGGSTLANLTAIWCAREHGARKIIASDDAHISVAKAAHILGMSFEAVPTNAEGRMRHMDLSDLSVACLVLTAGTTGRGVIDDLSSTSALWTHVDAAWAGPLRLTKYADRLDGIEHADSIALSAHKWFYQPKDSALILFKDETACRKVSYGGAYLATPNVGVQGSRGAAAIPLMATLLSWGRKGLAEKIERNMSDATILAHFLDAHEGAELKQMPETAVINWRPKHKPSEKMLIELGETSSRTKIENEVWIRQVAANPFADINLIMAKIERALN